MKKRKTILLAIDLAAMALLTYFDQLTKNLAVLYLKGKPEIPILRDVLVLQYLENKGAAFGMLQNQKIFFIFIEVLILFVIGFVLIKMPSHKKYNLMHVILVLVAGGAIGNMIDRMAQDYVVDFIYFVLIDFPIFNVADIYVTCATVLFVVTVLFYYKEEDFSFLSVKQKAQRTPNYTEDKRKAPETPGNGKNKKKAPGTPGDGKNRKEAPGTPGDGKNKKKK